MNTLQRFSVWVALCISFGGCSTDTRNKNIPGGQASTATESDASEQFLLGEEWYRKKDYAEAL
ncbi:MAG: hypothetical protein VXZ82_00340 [Planctomycetota bacterium]|nr:hypothetical protein [Planctomycetota bacterium]